MRGNTEKVSVRLIQASIRLQTYCLALTTKSNKKKKDTFSCSTCTHHWKEKYSRLKAGLTATFLSGAFFRTPNYSFVEEDCDEAHALTGCFHVWQANTPANQSTNPRAKASTKPSWSSRKPTGLTGQLAGGRISNQRDHSEVDRQTPGDLTGRITSSHSSRIFAKPLIAVCP